MPIIATIIIDTWCKVFCKVDAYVVDETLLIIFLRLQHELLAIGLIRNAGYFDFFIASTILRQTSHVKAWRAKTYNKWILGNWRITADE